MKGDSALSIYCMHDFMQACECITKIYDIHYEALHSPAGTQAGNKTPRPPVPSDHHPYHLSLLSHTHTCMHSGTLLPCLVPAVHSESPGIDPGFYCCYTAERGGGGVSRQRDASLWSSLQGVGKRLMKH